MEVLPKMWREVTRYSPAYGSSAVEPRRHPPDLIRGIALQAHMATLIACESPRASAECLVKTPVQGVIVVAESPMHLRDVSSPKTPKDGTSRRGQSGRFVAVREAGRRIAVKREKTLKILEKYDKS